MTDLAEITIGKSKFWYHDGDLYAPLNIWTRKRNGFGLPYWLAIVLSDGGHNFLTLKPKQPGGEELYGIPFALLYEAYDNQPETLKKLKELERRLREAASQGEEKEPTP